MPLKSVIFLVVPHELSFLIHHVVLFTDLSHAIRKNELSLWNMRLGHPSFNVIKIVINKCQIPFFYFFCSLCYFPLEKSYYLPFKHSNIVYGSPLQLIQANVWGPTPILSSKGFRYYVSFIDAYSIFTWLYLIKCKSEV